jgi:hypothetical protein
MANEAPDFPCDFCGDYEEVDSVFARESGAAICNRCLTVAKRILDLHGRFPDVDIAIEFKDGARKWTSGGGRDGS